MTRLESTLRRVSSLLNDIEVPPAVRHVVEQIIINNACPKLARSIQQEIPSSLGEVARTFRLLSLERAEIIGQDLLHDAAWHMMLTLFADAEEGKESFVSQLTSASGSPTTTALRSLKAMEDAGLVSRRDDASDGRKVAIVAKDSTIELMKQAIRRFCVAEPAASPSASGQSRGA